MERGWGGWWYEGCEREKNEGKKISKFEAATDQTLLNLQISKLMASTCVRGNISDCDVFLTCR